MLESFFVRDTYENVYKLPTYNKYTSVFDISRATERL